ncbi:penicillin-binding protein activator [Gilvimarinus agarilyticus]|uniref:penicillin-binding protein activator n=1 Tax=Gilvimarinus sp. 2_MG-2023 TaxID=3062666 RepID=UPI001C08F298|nr:penicillin-binding protein activator [Gilvimarinus sp. 2_MG-2023]MBU2885391.1 penicillin-binding protein activator [Gilvimarinus agarilyticus]MDO6570290.1 penicillin-binding protein activator [Gilvimarinus sp. 2_MG-2023]
MQRKLSLILAALAFPLLLASCSNQVDKPETDSGTQTLSESALEEKVNNLVRQARQASATERPKILLDAAQLLLEQDQDDWAFNLIQSIDPDLIGDFTFLQYTDTLSAAAIQSGHFLRARQLLSAPRLDAIWTLQPPAQQQRLLQRRAEIECLLGDYRQSLSARLELGHFLADANSQQYNNEAIWQDLMSLALSELENLRSAEQHELRGWAELAYISRNNAANLTEQLRSVKQWQDQWPQHPASLNTPSDLRLLNALIAQQPQKIALLLPRQGRLASAATAVRDGFLAAYYNLGQDEPKPSVRQYDTSGVDINLLVDQAAREGAELIIGPLAKENVEQLAARVQLPVPVLALNQQDINTSEPPRLNLPTLVLPTRHNPQLFTPELYQFGLAPEDEAEQIAQLAHLSGHKRAMIIAPDIDWAERSVQTFIEHWEGNGGEVILDSRYIGVGDFSGVIKSALRIDDSEERHQQLRSAIYTNMEFEPRRRKDIDVIFLIATPKEARQIKPTLAFHYAGDIPVIATSQIYTGEPNPKSDRDLNGIRFSTLPWLFDDGTETQNINSYTDAPDAYNRLHALGIDAFHLYPRLPQLKRLPQTRLEGATGILSMSPDRQINRQSVWAEFRDGTAQRLNTQPLATTADES